MSLFNVAWCRWIDYIWYFENAISWLNDENITLWFKFSYMDIYLYVMNSLYFPTIMFAIM